MNKLIEQSEINKSLQKMTIPANIGDLYMDSRHYYVIRVTGYGLNNGDKFCILVEHIDLHTGELSGRNSSYSIEDFCRDCAKMSSNDLNEAKEQAIKSLTNPIVDENSSSSDLSIGRANLNQMIFARDSMELARQTAKSQAAIIVAMTRGMSAFARSMGIKIDYLKRVISLIEARFGLSSSVITLRDGEPAYGKIYIMQRILFMNEEVGDVTRHRNFDNQIYYGISWKNIDMFDDWLLRDENYKLIVPHEKCIVAMSPRRRSSWSKSDEDRRLYFLIRNGSQLHRVECLMARNTDVLFPRQEQFDDILSRIEKYAENGNESYEYDAKNEQLDWLEQVAVIQWFLSESNTLRPHKDVDIFDPQTYGGVLEIVRDAEDVLGDGHLPYRDWVKLINSHIKKGSRIHFSGDSRLIDLRNRLPDKYYTCSGFALPAMPEFGVYTIDKFEASEKEKHIKQSDGSYKPEMVYIWNGSFLYMPTDEIWDSALFDRAKRKNRVSFSVSISDSFILNYDLLTVEDVEFYISNRSERENYESMLPALIHVHALLIEERKEEQGFIELMSESTGYSIEDVGRAIRWWKMKVGNVRAIKSDNKKAWRMIRNYLSGNHYGVSPKDIPDHIQYNLKG